MKPHRATHMMFSFHAGTIVKCRRDDKPPRRPSPAERRRARHKSRADAMRHDRQMSSAIMWRAVSAACRQS